MGFNAYFNAADGIATITLEGDLDAAAAGVFRELVERAAAERSRHLVLEMTALDYISSAGLRQLIFTRQKMDDDVRLVLVGATKHVKQTIKLVGFDRSLTFSDRTP